MKQRGRILVTCESCGKQVPEIQAFEIGRLSELHHFCSVACREGWRERSAPKLVGKLFRLISW